MGRGSPAEGGPQSEELRVGWAERFFLIKSWHSTAVRAPMVRTNLSTGPWVMLIAHVLAQSYCVLGFLEVRARKFKIITSWMGEPHHTSEACHAHGSPRPRLRHTSHAGIDTQFSRDPCVGAPYRRITTIFPWYRRKVPSAAYCRCVLS